MPTLTEIYVQASQELRVEIITAALLILEARRKREFSNTQALVITKPVAVRRPINKQPLRRGVRVGSYQASGGAIRRR